MEKQRGLLAVTRERMRVRRLSLRTEQAYLQWLRRYVAFHGRRHPREVGAAGIEQFLTHLAVVRKVSALRRIRHCRHCCFCIGTYWALNCRASILPTPLLVDACLSC